ncbi:uncharacterized protein LOC131321072 [Rhododendron vialii]|uniref:uncharacterized protein LOC131321072 n=1 Tax=Rhododendron vialii TaxID=182163 RepID=UPI00265EAD81|nr:uncharacterized protein LOC131321072 [Rhododendron vialii]
MESSSNVNSTGSPREKWPYPTSEINVLDIVPKLSSERNYGNWRLSMRDFIRVRGLIGFIEGTAVAAGESNRDEAWNGSNNLVRGWILATLSEDIRPRVLRYETAKDLWTELEKIFDATRSLWRLDEETEYRQGHYLALQKAAINGDWDKAMVIIELEPDAVRTPITPNSQTALSLAISSASAGRNLFVRELLEKMTPQDVVHLSNNRGATALHYAASIDNMEGARMLVNKNLDLPNVPDKSGETSLHYAAKYGHREMVLYLNKVTREDILLDLANGRKGASLLVCLLTSSELYDIALTLLKREPELACMEPNPFEFIAEKHSSFPSGNSSNIRQSLFYLVPVKSEGIVNHHNEGGGRGDIENPAAANCCISGLAITTHT